MFSKSLVASVAQTLVGLSHPGNTQRSCNVQTNRKDRRNSNSWQWYQH